MQPKVLFITCLLTMLAWGCSTKPPGAKQHSSRPNVIIIFTDDQGYQDLGCFGASGFETPNLDRLAREGALLTQFYTAQPVCSGARQQPLHDLLFFYYNQNEMQAVRYYDWKLYFPHAYRSMGNNPPGRDGQPERYQTIQITAPELYNLKTDPSERHNVAGQNPAAVADIMAAADSMRLKLGDKLRGMEGAENRLPGRKTE